jgi:hypothetical protein
MLTLQNRVNRRRNQMTQDERMSWHPYWGRETLITAIAIGGFLIILGMVFVVNAELPNQIETFFRNLNSVSFPSGSTSNFRLPTPVNTAAHSGMYTALMEFDVAFGMLQILILALRLASRSPIRKIAETVDHAIFWLGSALLVNVFLLAGTLSAWFQYWALLIVLIGVGVIVRGLILIVARRKPKQANAPQT